MVEEFGFSNDSALLAEPALAQDWLKPEEDEAWAHLQFRVDHPLPPECQRSAEAMDAHIQAERDAWD